MIEDWIQRILAGGGLLAGIAAVYQVRVSRRAGVSGDEREARRDEAAQRRDTIADRDAFIVQLAGRIEQLEANEVVTDARIKDLEKERDTWHRRYDEEQDYTRILVDHIYRGAEPPPPPRPQPRTT